MQELWLPVQGFNYSVSNLGNVKNDHTDRILKPNATPSVNLRKDGRYYCLYLPRLVASHWVPNPHPPFFDTPMHLDGDKYNCCADNFVWRTRWFVDRYMQERRNPHYKNWKRPIVCIETGEVFRIPDDVCRTYGVMEHDVYRSVFHGERVFPVKLHFEIS